MRIAEGGQKVPEIATRGPGSSVGGQRGGYRGAALASAGETGSSLDCSKLTTISLFSLSPSCSRRATLRRSSIQAIAAQALSATLSRSPAQLYVHIFSSLSCCANLSSHSVHLSLGASSCCNLLAYPLPHPDIQPPDVVTAPIIDCINTSSNRTYVYCSGLLSKAEEIWDATAIACANLPGCRLVLDSEDVRERNDVPSL